MPSPAHLTPFNSETGKQAGIKSTQVRLELMENGKKLHDVLERIGQKTLESQSGLPGDVQREVNRQIELTNEQLACTRARLNDTESHWCEECERGGLGDKERAGLLRELRGLMEHLCRLHGIPEAGSLKPTAKATPRQRIPEPVLVSPCGPDTPTPSVPLGQPETGTPQVL